MDRTTQIFLIIFTVAIALSVFIQACAILVMLVIVRKQSRRVTALVDEFRAHVMPLVVSSRETAEAISPKLKVIAANLAETTTNLRSKADRVGSAVSEIVDRTHAQAVRIDGMVDGTLSHISSTAAAIQQGVAAPARQFHGILNGIRAAMDVMRQGPQSRL